MLVKCPTCKNEVEFTAENPYRPFCSQRCSTLDLGAWADEKYRVPIEVYDGDEALEDSEGVNENPESENAAPRESTMKHHLN